MNCHDWTYELSFLVVAALPKVSRIGFAFNNCCSSSPACDAAVVSATPIVVRREFAAAVADGLFALPEAATVARYWITFFVFSVLPAPDSPVHRMAWSSLSCSMSRYAASATANMCGGSLPDRPLPR